MAMIKLQAMAEARSVKPTVFTCLKKKMMTSYKGTPSKPGRYKCLLFRKKNETGGLVIIIRSSLVIHQILEKAFIGRNYWAASFKRGRMQYLNLPINKITYKPINWRLFLSLNYPKPAGILLHTFYVPYNLKQSLNNHSDQALQQKTGRRYWEHSIPHQWFLKREYKLGREEVLNFDTYYRAREIAGV